jgi:hypothetical protein
VSGLTGSGSSGRRREDARQLERAGMSRRDAQAIAAGPPGPAPRPAGRRRHAQEGSQAQAAADERERAAQQLAAEWIILEARVRARFPGRRDAADVLAQAGRIVEQLRTAQAGKRT